MTGPGLRLLGCVVGLTGVLLTTIGVSASLASSSTRWFWSPGYCKSVLRQYGVQLGDRRTFNVDQANCVGWGGTQYCEWGEGNFERQYSRFHVVVRSFDGVVRGLDIKTTGKKSWSGLDDSPQILGRNVSRERFASAGAYMQQWARESHEKGCRPYSGP